MTRGNHRAERRPGRRRILGVAVGQLKGEVVSETSTVTVWCWWPRAIFWPTTMITPVLLARRWTRAGSADGRGSGPAGRASRRSVTWAGVSGFQRVRSSSRVRVRGAAGAVPDPLWRCAWPPAGPTFDRVRGSPCSPSVAGHSEGAAHALSLSEIVVAKVVSLERRRQARRSRWRGSYEAYDRLGR
jgi:hypothetical protein